MTVAQRLYLLTTAALLGLAGITGLGLVQMDRVYEATNFTNVNVVPSLLALDRAFSALDRLQGQGWHYLALRQPQERDALERRMEEQHGIAVAALDQYEREYIADPHDRALLAAVRRAPDRASRPARCCWRAWTCANSWARPSSATVSTTPSWASRPRAARRPSSRPRAG